MLDCWFARCFRRVAATLALPTPLPRFTATAVPPVLPGTRTDPATGCPVTAVKGTASRCRAGPRLWLSGGLLACTLVFAPASIAAPCAGFTDMEDTSGFCANVEWIRNRGVTVGCTGTTYCPNNPVSRLAMAAFMNRLGTALTPTLLSVDFAPGAIDLDAGLVVCQTQDFVVTDFPRRAYVDLSFSANATADVAVAADVAMSTNKGANWTMLNTAVNRGLVAANQWGALADLGFADLAVGQTVRFGVMIGRGGAAPGADLSGSRCALRVLVFSRTGRASPL